MELKETSRSRIKSCILKALERYATADAEQSSVTDIHIFVDSTNGEMEVYDDDDTVLASTVVDEWVSYEDDDFDDETSRLLTSVLSRIKNDGGLDKVNIIRPYSFVLVDERKETVAELLLMDDDLMIVNDELMKGLDDDLNDFLKDLLKD